VLLLALLLLLPQRIIKILSMAYLIAGLGNIGAEYANTRHNIGFIVLDAFARASNIVFESRRYGSVAEYRYKGKDFVFLKPSTYMNLSGRAVSYWLRREKIPIENLLVISDDVALPLGSMRMRKQGSDGGHNGLCDIIVNLGTNKFARLRIGIGDNFPRGHQVDYVIGEWSEQERKELPFICDKAAEAMISFAMAGIERTMNTINTK
jgi:peptidyl-tRNA hydrolase